MRKNLLLEKFLHVRKTTEDICSPLEIEDYTAQPVIDVSPPKWHLAHSTWFFEKFILEQFSPDFKPFHPKYNFLFNSYYESIGERTERIKRGDMTRPTVKNILDYRHTTTEKVTSLIEKTDEEKFSRMKNFFELGINHEQQHQELLFTDIKYILCRNPLDPVYLPPDEKFFSKRKISSVESKFIEIPEGIYEIGHSGENFAFDNESPRHKIFLHAFALQNRPVTNWEYLGFIEDGGYEDFRHWLSEAWEAMKIQPLHHPMYWHKIDDKWFEMTLRGLQELDLNAPVCHISYFEAEAFASWSGKRLPTEAEWELAYFLGKNSSEENFSDDKIFHPVAAAGDENSFHHMLGNIWEWTQSAYLPYRGYKQAEGALGEYNGKFMINQMVLRGGSCATPKDHIRPTYRNFFPANLRWQFSGVRLAEDR